MSAQFYLPFVPILNSRGLPSSGAMVYFYLSGTTTPTTPYADSGLTTPLANPVVSDVFGHLPTIYLDTAKTYRVRVTDANGVQYGSDFDPYTPGQVGDFAGAIVTAANTATAEANAAAASANAAAGSAAAAQIASGPFYTSISAGNAATSAGQNFNVDNGDGTFSVYPHGASSSANALYTGVKNLTASTAAAHIGADDGASGSLFTTVQSFIAKLLSSAGSSIVGFIAAGAGAVFRTMQDKQRESVSVLDYGAVGDGVTDDSAAIQAAVDANKGGTIKLPQGKTFLADGIAFNGPTYNGTTLLIEGVLLMKPRANSSTWNWDLSGSPTYNAIILYDCEYVTVDVPGMIDGNRTNQPNTTGSDQQCHCLQLRGVRNFSIPRFNAREVRGDGIIITTKTNLAPLSTNSANGTIGPVNVTNTADDGRNAVSITSGVNISLAGGTSTHVGGTIGGLLMPGGLDIEPDGSWHFVQNIVSGPWAVTTAGTSGISINGKALTSDATRDWIATDVTIAPSVVIQTSSNAGGPLFSRCARVTADVTLVRTGGRGAGCNVDYADYCNVRFVASGCSNAVTLGYSDFVNDSKIHAEVQDHSADGVLAVGVNRSRISGYVRNGQGAGSYGVQVSPAGRGTVTQSAVTYSVDVPYDANNSFGFLTSSGVTFVDGCSVSDCAFLGYPDFSTMFGFNVFIPTRNVQGRNFASAAPTNGYWAASDIVWNTGTAAAGTPGWVNTAAGQPGTWKAMANVAA